LLQTPAVTLSSTSVMFGNQGVGTTSPPQSITLTNSGSAPLAITNVTITGDFTQTNDCGASAAAGANCTISVTFKPTALGARTGTLTITDNASGSPQTVALAGTATGPVVSLSTATLAFAAQLTGSTSAAHSVTLNNTGNGVLSITSITTSGDFAQTNTCGSSVAAGASCAISVTFTAAAGGNRTGSLTITDNAADSPESVALSGVAEDFQITHNIGGEKVTDRQTGGFRM